VVLPSEVNISNLCCGYQSTLPDSTPTKEDIYGQTFENIMK